MPATLVIQSHREPLPHAWLRACLDSVAAWARLNGFDYRYLGDELFDLLDPDLRDKTAKRPVIASDLARLYWLRQGLEEGYACVVWCDADFLVFDPSSLVLPGADFALGREVWVQCDERKRLRVHAKVHNALLMFRPENCFLDFYASTAARLLRLNDGGMPPQFIGPKLLTALHNIAHFPVMERAGMLSPPVLRDLLAGRGAALELFLAHSPASLAGANLGASLVTGDGIDDRLMEQVIDGLLRRGIPGAGNQSIAGGGSLKA